LAKHLVPYDPVYNRLSFSITTPLSTHHGSIPDLLSL
jgi:hypothetical protein